MQPSCNHCAFRSERPFCEMSPDAIRSFDEIKEQAVLGKGALLFAEGRPSRGVYVLCEGRAKLSICSESGKRLMLRVAGPGEVWDWAPPLAATPMRSPPNCWIPRRSYS